MIIKKAENNDFAKSLTIAKNLKEWFTDDAIKNMKVDFALNNLIIALEDNQAVGFLCYTSNNSMMHILWLGVKKDSQRKGIGVKLLNWLIKESKKLKLKAIVVETLPDEDSYEPYKLTRNFYYKNGFKRIAYKKARVKGWEDQIVLEKVL